jgi:hypothetical protein
MSAPEADPRASNRAAALADAWERNDESMAAVALDRTAAAEARGRRELVCDLLLTEAPTRELLTALHAYGRLLAERGASPSVLSVTIDGARAAVGEKYATALGPSARAAVTEGYFAATREALGADALRAWDPPACIARIGEGVFAVAARLPSAEPDEVDAWATRVARWLVAQKATTAIVDGDARLVREVSDAVKLAGIEVEAPADAEAHAPGSAGAEGAGAQGKKRGLWSKILG